MLELLKEKGEVTKQKNIEIAQLDKAQRDYIFESAELKAEHGISLPNMPQPTLESYNIDDVPLNVEDANNQVSGSQ